MLSKIALPKVERYPRHGLGHSERDHRDLPGADTTPHSARPGKETQDSARMALPIAIIKGVCAWVIEADGELDYTQSQYACVESMFACGSPAIAAT